MKPLTAATIVALATLWSAHPASAQDSEITAADVVDRETLKEFVHAALAYADQAATLPEYLGVLQEFRVEGRWKHGSTYIFIGIADGTIIFHAANPDLEGVNLWDLEDANGVKYTQELIAAAAEGGGFVEYLFDNPEIEGDEEAGSPKVGYAAPYSAFGQDVIVGSGFYPESPATAVAGQSWGWVKGGLWTRSLLTGEVPGTSDWA